MPSGAVMRLHRTAQDQAGTQRDAAPDKGRRGLSSNEAKLQHAKTLLCQKPAVPPPAAAYQNILQTPPVAHVPPGCSLS